MAGKVQVNIGGWVDLGLPAETVVTDEQKGSNGGGDETPSPVAQPPQDGRICLEEAGISTEGRSDGYIDRAGKDCLRDWRPPASVPQNGSGNQSGEATTKKRTSERRTFSVGK